VLLDLSLGDADGFDLLAELRLAHPGIPVVVVSASERASDVIRAIDLGAMGFVPKRSSNTALFEALRMVMSGGLYVPPTMLGLDFSQLPADDLSGTQLSTSGAGPGLGGAARPDPPAGRLHRPDRTHASPDRGAGAAAQGPAQQAHRARAQPVGRDGEGPRGGRAARAGRQHAHPGRRLPPL
jgi:hypothetical protein